MSAVVSFRIPRELKRRMERFKDVNWAELLRKFIEEQVEKLEAEEILKTINEHLRDVPELPRGTVVRWLREDRESH